MIRARSICLFWAFAALLASPAAPSRADPGQALHSVVSVLPVWPGRAQGGEGAAPGVAPEGSGVVIGAGGLIATAWHVVEQATRIDVRLADGRVLPARLIAQDAASDIALLRVDAALPPFEIAERPALADRVCAIGNAFGLGLSVTCGVVSAREVTEAGFNAVEDFVQTDAAANPGSSGGGLVDRDGRLVGMISAIFASEGDANIGVNFAVSAPLLMRVADELLADGAVDYASAGWRLARPSRAVLATSPGAIVADVAPDGPAAAADVMPGDLVVGIGDRVIRKPRDAVAALALVPPGATAVEVRVRRGGETLTVALDVAAPATTPDETQPPAEVLGDCPHPEAVCRARQAVFPISSFNPLASATRIAPNLLVTNRHVVGDRADAVVYTPDGPRGGVVVASAYLGDLALVAVEGLPVSGMVFDVAERPIDDDATFFAVGADVSRQEVRVFNPGPLIAGPLSGAALGRLHVASFMQPGASGGALVDEAGRLVGVSVGGGEGRYEAIPVADVLALLALRDDDAAATVQTTLGAALARCENALEAVRLGSGGADVAGAVSDGCDGTSNQGQFLEAGRLLAEAGAFDAAIEFHTRAVEQTPNSINARLTLLVSLQLGGRFAEMLPHARWMMAAAPDDPQALRFAIQSGVWGGDADLAEAAYAALEASDPRQAQAARRFIDSAPPAPPRR